jgi:isoleucyl-tRNA synthetase
VSLGRAARQTAGLRVRQPLSELLVRTPEGGQRLRRFEDELLDELNVKKLRILEGDEALVQYRFNPNLPLLGRKYRKLVPAIKVALAALEGEEASAAARAVEAGEPFEIRVDGQSIRLEPEEVLMDVTSPEGYTVAGRNRLLVALNTTVTPELRLEGQARDLVRFIQDARKSAGFDITDRITVTLRPGKGMDLGDLLAKYGDFIRSETLATSMALRDPEEGAHVVEAELDGGSVTIGIRR